ALDKAKHDKRCANGGIWYEAWRLVNTQFAATVVGHELLRRHLLPKLSPNSQELLDKAVTTLDQDLEGGGYPTFLSLGVRILRWNAISNRADRAAEGEAIRQDCERLASDPAGGELTDLDKAELKFFAGIVGRASTVSAI